MKTGVMLAALCAGLTGAGLEARLSFLERVSSKLGISGDAEIIADARSNNSDDHLAERVEVPCPPSERTMIALIAGQSNTANFAARRTTAGPRVSVYYRGRCYQAKDPLLGATGNRGSVWPAFADQVIASGRFENVMLVPASVGGTSIESWAPGGIHFDRIDSRLQHLAAQGLRPTHILFGQGEFEAVGGDGEEYRRRLNALIKALKPTGARLVLATTSVCGASNPAVRAAQERVRKANGVAAGPDMDVITDRINGCHLGAAGQAQAAKAWAASVLS